jgi:phage terminase large subunit-like protein
LWSEKLLDDTRVLDSFEMKFKRVALGIDPSGSDGKSLDGSENDADAIGIVAVGLGEDDHLYVLEDATINASPTEWAKKAIKTYQNRYGDIIVCESNYGGAMCESVIRNVTDDRTIRIKLSRSQRSKYVRAEPILALYEQGLAHHVGVFDKLEEEMTTYKAGSKSPNRMDALVFACTELGKIVPMAVQKTVKGLF